MQYLCQNGIDFEECENKVERKGDTCDECQENAYESFLESYYGGSQPLTLDEQMAEARKLK